MFSHFWNNLDLDNLKFKVQIQRVFSVWFHPHKRGAKSLLISFSTWIEEQWFHTFLSGWDQSENTFQDYKWPLMPFIDIPYNSEKWILTFSSLSSVVWFSIQFEENNMYIVKKSKRTKSNVTNTILFWKLFRPIMRKKMS